MAILVETWPLAIATCEIACYAAAAQPIQDDHIIVVMPPGRSYLSLRAYTFDYNFPTFGTVSVGTHVWGFEFFQDNDHIDIELRRDDVGDWIDSQIEVIKTNSSNVFYVQITGVVCKDAKI